MARNKTGHACHDDVHNHPDIVCRVFKQKLDSLMHEIKSGNVFSNDRSVTAHVEVTQFQHRGGLHAHTLRSFDKFHHIIKCG